MLRPMPIEPIPPETARIARAAFPKSHRYLRLADELDTLFTDEAFGALFPHTRTTRMPPMAARAGHHPPSRGGTL